MNRASFFPIFIVLYGGLLAGKGGTDKNRMMNLKHLLKVCLTGIIGVCVVAVACATPPPPPTGAHYVTLLTDSYAPGEFRYEIENAAAGDTVFVDVRGTVVLGTPVVVSQPVVIIGPNPIHFTVDGTGIGGGYAIQVTTAGASPAEFHNFRITNNAGEGVVVDPSAQANFKFMVFEGCAASFTGGGIANNGGVVTVISCSFIGNTSGGFGGGIFNANSGNLTVVNTTFFQNLATDSGGGIYNDGGATVNLINNTFLENDAGTAGGGVFGGSGTIIIRNNIFHDNTQGFGPLENLADGGAVWTSTGGNVINQNSFAFVPWLAAQPSDSWVNGNDPMISRAAPLIDGLGMQYFPIQNSGSVAVNRDNTGTNPSSELYDVRLSYRQHIEDVFTPLRLVDAGAVEYTPFIVSDPDGTGAPIAGSLQGVVNDLNGMGAANGPFSIVFELPGSTVIDHGSAANYDIWQDGTTINGYTQEGSMCAGPGNPGTPRTPANNIVEINGLPSVGQPGLFIGAVNVIVAGLTINNHNMAGQNGIHINGDVATIVGNHIGTSTDGMNAQPNDIGVFMDIDDNIIGGPENSGLNGYLPGLYYTRGNVISGNTQYQIRDDGYANIIRGNLIGPDATGLSLPIGAPVTIAGYSSASGSGKMIGGDVPAKRNIISGNGTGVYLDGAVSNSYVYGNFIGTDITGMGALPNGEGMFIGNVNGIQVGSSVAGTANVISGNSSSGIYMDGSGSGGFNYIQGNLIGTDAIGLNALGNGTGITVANGTINTYIGGSASGEGNVISGHISGVGINIQGAGTTGNNYWGNIIGLDKDGLNGLPNSVGISISNGASEIIGGTGLYGSGEGNTISGNAGFGIEVQSDAGAGIRILGNIIGLQSNGTTPVIGNTQTGMALSNTFMVLVGDGSLPGPGSGNIISGNGNAGVYIDGDNHVIQTNGIGIESLGNPLGNNIGVWINGGNGNYIIGNGPGLEQVISGNNTFGIEITNSASGNIVQGNLIGTTTIGESSPGGFANVQAGIRIANGANNNTVGGVGVNQRNVISGNGVGIELLDATTMNNRIGGNYIGTNKSTGANSIPNASHGIAIDAASSNYIGFAAGVCDGNVISGNSAGAGIFIHSGAIGNYVLGNVIGTDPSSGNANPNNYGIILNNAVDNFIGQPGANDGNVISGNTNAGIQMENGTNGTLVENNRIGTNMGGTAVPTGTNQQDGIVIMDGSFSNYIGAPGPDRNIISGHIGVGVVITDALTISNVVENNIIGLDASGTVPLPNDNGVKLDAGANGNYIGYQYGATGNVISGNFGAGVKITGGAHDNWISGNDIGTGAGGTALAGTSNEFGVEIDGNSDFNNIGGDQANLEQNVITGNVTAGIRIIDSDYSWIGGNFIGALDGGGAYGGANQTNGIVVESGADNTIIGDQTLVGLMNLISDNTGGGIALDGSSGTPVDGTLIQNNFIGTRLDGVTAMGNGGNGIFGINAPNTTIGGPGTNEYNVISANGNNGIEFYNSGTTGLVIQSNMIGVDYTGVDPSAALGNGNNGIALRDGVNGALIGGASGSGESNIIGGHVNSAGIMMEDVGANDVKGNNIGVDISGVTAVPNNIGIVINVLSGTATGNTVGGVVGSGEDNILAGNLDWQVVVVGANSTGNTIIGNLIGVDIAQNIVGPPTGGVAFGGTGSNTLGGLPAATYNNVIGGCDTAVVIDGSSNVTVEGNYIGMQDNGLTAISNSIGVSVQSGSTGATIGPDNLISANALDGIVIRDPGTDGNTVIGNFIGTDGTGNATSAGLGNASGIIVDNNANGNIIGTPGNGNVVSGNNFSGIRMQGGSTGTLVQGNYMGVGIDGVSPVGNAGEGVAIDVSSSNIIGGDNTAGEQNYIGYNGLFGIYCSVGNGSQILGNFIGVDMVGGSAPNGSDGIYVNSCSGLTIGQSGSGGVNANEIANNLGNGINFQGPPPSDGIRISENSIHDNSGIGIDLENNGPTSNDLGDVDGGENFGQNFPFITSAFECGGSGFTSVGFDYDFQAGTYLIEFFVPDASGAEGETFIESTTITSTGAPGSASHTLASLLGIGSDVIATATEITSGRTSEFSFPAFTVTAPPAVPTIGTDATYCDGDAIADLTATGYTGEVVWFSDAGLTIPLGSGEPFTPPNIIGPGTYTYYAVDSVAGCYSAAAGPVTLTVNALPIPVITGAATACEGSTATYMVSAYPSVLWSLITSNASILTSATGSTTDIIFGGSPFADDSLIVTVTDVFGCVNSDTLVVTVNPLPVGTTNLSQPTCAGSSDGMIDLIVTGTPTFVFDWDNDGTGDTDDPEDLTGLMAGTYNVVFTDGNGCSNSLGVTLVDPSPINISTPTFSDVSCNGAADGTTSVSGATGGAGGFTYDWQMVGGSSVGTGISATGLSPGDYFVIVQDANGCAINSDTVTVSEPMAITGSVTPFDISCNGLCDGMMTASSILGGVSPYTYTWQDGVGTTVGTSDTASGLCVDTYTLIVTDAGGCSSVIGSAGIAEPAPLSHSVIITNESCGLANGSIEVTAGGGTGPYQFSNDGGTVWNSGASPYTFTGLAAGSYDITVLDDNGCLTTVTTEVVGSSGSVVAVLDSIIGTPCFGPPSLGEVQISVTGGTTPYSFDWDNDGTGDTDDPEDITNLPVGTYQVIVYDVGGCSDTISGIVVPGPPNAVGATVVPTHALCADSLGSVTATGVSGGWGSTYTYSIDLVAFNSLPDFGGLPAGSYTYYVQDSTCVYSFPFVINEPAPITFNTILTDPVCDSTSGIIEIVGVTGGTGGPYAYSVASFDTNYVNFTGTFGGLSADSYAAGVADLNGCIGIAFATLIYTGVNCDELIVSNAFSPDGDGTNDFWILAGLLNHPENHVVIYNRWGDVLNEFDNYDNVENVWDGSNSSGELLPAGTYFYTIELIPEGLLYSGWVHLSR